MQGREGGKVKGTQRGNTQHMKAGEREKEIAARMTAIFNELLKDPEVQKVLKGE